MKRKESHGEHDTEGTVLTSLPQAVRGPMPPAADLLDNGDRPEQQDERQDAVELEITPQVAEDAWSGGAPPGGSCVPAETWSRKARTAAGARRGPGWKPPPPAARR